MHKTQYNKFSPCYLAFCHESRLPIDIILQREEDPQHTTNRQYIENWKEVMEDAYATAPQNSAYRKEHDEERKLQAG